MSRWRKGRPGLTRRGLGEWFGRRAWWMLLLIVLGAALSPSALAEGPLRVAVKEAPPFVIVKGGTPTGFSIDLMREVAKRMVPGRPVAFEVEPDLETQLSKVEQGKVDLGIAATTITAERERRLDFSHPFYRSGLGILVRAEGGIGATLGALVSSQLAWIALGTILYVILCAHIIWWTERGSSAFDDRWFPGVSQGIWWVIVTMSTVGYGDIVPKKVISKVLAVFIIFSGITLFGVTVASITSALTVKNLRSDIHGPGDLSERQVAVIRGTAAERAMERQRARVAEVHTVEEAAAQVERGKVEAAVHDVPLLRHYLKTHAASGLELTGVVFDPAQYGASFPSGSALRDRFNIALLDVMADGTYDVLRQRWFGARVVDEADTP
jgi:polar amino acid transport system substrate-binding protein